MKPRLTPWIGWPTNPTLPGWYDVRFWTAWGDRTFYGKPARWRWDGERFASKAGVRFSLVPGDQWRGLAEPPENSHAS